MASGFTSIYPRPVPVLVPSVRPPSAVRRSRLWPPAVQRTVTWCIRRLVRGRSCLFALVTLALLTMPAVASAVRFKGELVSETRGTTRISLVGRAVPRLTPVAGDTVFGVARCRPLTGRCFQRRGRFQLTLNVDALHATLTFGAVQCSLSGQFHHLGCRSPCGESFQGTYTCVREARDVDQGVFGLSPLPIRPVVR